MSMNSKIKFLAATLFCSVSALAVEIASLSPVPQSADAGNWWVKRHAAKLELAQKGGSRVVFVGDSITHFWESRGAEQWQRNFAGEPYRALDLGFSADRTEHVLWRIAHGEFDGYEAKAIVLMIGTNNTGHKPFEVEPPCDTFLGVRAVLRALQAKQPKARIILHPIFPCGATPDAPSRRRNAVVNAELRKLADGERIGWCDFTDRLLEADGSLSRAIMPDYLHPGPAGYGIWAEAVKPWIDAALGDRPFPKPAECRWTYPAPREKGELATYPQTRVMQSGGGGTRKPGWWEDRILEKRREIKASGGTFDVVFFGDSITHFWERQLSKNGDDAYSRLRKRFRILNLGYGGDSTQHLVWRGENGELDGYRAKLVMLMIGTNNRGRPADVASGVKRVIEVVRRKQPQAKILLLPIFPRGESAADPHRVRNEAVNALIRGYADGKDVLWTDFNARLVDAKGDVKPFMNDRLHPNATGYGIWSEAVSPVFERVCGKGGAVKVSVDASVVRAEVPRTLYGTGMEDVNHEIYGGLDAQRLYDESFEETLPPQVIPHSKKGAGKKTCGRQWEAVLTGGGAERLDEREKHLGARAQVLEPNGGTAGVANRGLNGWGVPCREGRRMVGHFFAKGAVDRLEVALQRGDGRITYATNVVALAAGDGWRRVDFALVPDTTDPQGRFLIRASGAGRIWIDDAYLADEPTNAFGRIGCREDIVEGFRREGLTFLRWGGTMVNTPEYSLRNCRGDRRPYRGFWFRTSSTGFHVREFVRMSAAMGLPCAFSIYTYEDTDEAVKLAEWLRQFDIPLYVAIGNEEVTGWGEDAGAKCDLASCRKYGESLRRIVTAMRKVNPKLKFVTEVMYRPSNKEVMEEAFRQADGYADYWDIHVGAARETSGRSARNMLQGFRDMVRRLNPKSTMKAAIFEENSYNHDMRRALAHASILEAAREMGDFLLTSCPANALQPYAQNDNGWDQGQIFFTTDRVWLQPCGWAQQMASSNHRDLLLDGKTDDPDAVTVSATCDRAKKSFVLHLVNVTAEPKEVEIALKGGAAARLAKVTSLSAPRLEDRNPPDDPERISPRDVTAEFAKTRLLGPYSYTVVEFK